MLVIFFLVKRRFHLNQNITSRSVHSLLKKTPLQSSSKALAKSTGDLKTKCTLVLVQPLV